MPSLALLVASVGSLVGQNILDMLDGRRGAVRLVGTSSLPEEPRLYDCDAVHLAPPTADRAAFGARLLEVMEAERPDLVLVGRDEDVRAMAALAEARPDLAPRMTVGGLEAAEMMLDKLETFRFAQAHGLPFADSAVPGRDGDLAEVRALAARHGFPLIAKPREGFASRGVALVLEAAQLEAYAGAPGWMFQPMLDAGPDFAACLPDLRRGLPLCWSLPANFTWIHQAIVAPDGRVHDVLNRAEIVMGRAEYCEPADEPGLLEVGRAWTRALAGAGWRGPLNVQCKRTPAGEFVAFELNGRLTGASSARALQGFDELGLLVEAFCGPGRLPSFAAPPRRRVWKGLRDRALDEDVAAALRARGVWRRRD